MTKEKIMEIVSLCLDVNGLKERQQEKTGSLPTVFFEFAGHVAMLSVRVFENGWAPNSVTSEEFRFYINRDNDEDCAELIDALKKLQKNSSSGSTRNEENINV